MKNDHSRRTLLIFSMLFIYILFAFISYTAKDSVFKRFLFNWESKRVNLFVSLISAVLIIRTLFASFNKFTQKYFSPQESFDFLLT